MNVSSHSMSVKEIMTTSVVTMPPTATVLEVARSMTKMNIGSVVIVEAGRAVGIVTETDIVRRLVAEELDPRKTSVGEIMSSPIVHVTPETPLTTAMRLMARNDIRRLIVLRNDSLVGIITSRDILEWSPELIDILVESLRMKGGGRPVRSAEEEDEIVTYGGICDGCEEYSTDLVLEDGRYLCENCRN
ncbi:MAG: CBS domain-containing protein [Candidatus Thorarchaeota archaeon]